MLPGPSRRIAAIVVCLALVASACSGTSDDQSSGDDTEQAVTGDGSGAERTESDQTGADGEVEGDGPEPLDPMPMEVRPGPFQLTVDGSSSLEPVGPDASIEVLDQDGTVVGQGSLAENGTSVIRQLPPGPVTVEVTDGDRRFAVTETTIPGEAVEDTSVYQDQELGAGFGYITTRDGTQLSAFVSLPGSANAGPYPTLVEYSGYSPSDPTAADDPYRLLIPALGYALVQVNVRGTGCSGGSFDAFERIQSLDGYDVIETVSAQPWSAKVGMFGVSYPAIMQLHVASTRPPSLAAIAPLSPLGRVDSVLYPGGIFNDGFGQEWSDQVGSRARENGQPWAADRVARGDQTCKTNQELRVHNPDLVGVVRDNPFIDDLANERSAETHAAEINVPTFIAGAWQDEQTGGRFTTLLDELENAPVLRAILYNGLHIDAISGEMLVKLIEFFNLYVGDRPAEVPPVVRVLIGVGLSGFFGSDLSLPDGSYEGLTVEEARTRFEADDPIEVLFEQGATAANLPVPAFRARFAAWPPQADDDGEVLHLGGATDALTLTTARPETAVTATFTTDPAEGQVTTAPDVDAIWTAEPGWDWPVPDPANSVIATTGPLDDELVLVGNLSADLWVAVEDGTDADLEVTVSEVAPDGSETYVQSGWLRLSRRDLSDQATALRPIISGLEGTVAPVELGGEPVLARVEVLPFAHVFRQGSRIRMTVDTPGASKPRWRFDVAEQPVQVTVHAGPETPSRIVLPVVAGVDVPTDRPPCGSLRGQPCRPG